MESTGVRFTDADAESMGARASDRVARWWVPGGAWALAAVVATVASPAVQGAGKAGAGPALEVDLRSSWAADIALANPHKGWYHHYPDNHPGKYEIAADRDLLEFPGMDHLYIRLAWSYLEPREGVYRWEVIDPLIEKWVGKGLGIAFRISCKETSTSPVEQQFATPRWVMEAGAKGGHYRSGKRTGPDGPWEPVFDDPIFLAKLEGFLRAFAARYDGKPWLRYVDIGSIGDWGEGHTHSGSRLSYGLEARRAHVDLHLKHFRESQLVISDDFVHALGDPADRARLHRHIVAHGIAYRDDSILVDYYVRAHGAAWCVRSPELFADAWRKTPQVLELQHYGAVKRDGNWVVRPGSSADRFGGGRDGPAYFRGALGVLHATYIGYHGYAREWLDDNPELTVELLNRCGYWYFPHSVATPATWTAGERTTLRAVWENRGVAPAYDPFELRLSLVGPAAWSSRHASGNRRWLPRSERRTWEEEYRIAVPRDTAAGVYELRMKLHSPRAGRDVRLALRPSLLDDSGFYRIGKVTIRRGG